MNPLEWWRQDAAGQSKDKDWHPEQHRYGWPGHSNDPKTQDAGSSTTGQTWSELDPDGRGGGGWAWRFMTRRDWLIPRRR